MWTEARLALSRIPWSVARALGTAPVSVTLAVVAGVYVATDALWGGGAGGAGVSRTWEYWALAGAALIDAAIGLARTAPLWQRPDGSLGLVAVDLASASRLGLRLAWMLAALALVASLASRDRFVFRVAEGETLVPVPEQLVRRDPPRRMSPGPFRIDATVERVDASGGDVRAELRSMREARSASKASPAWYGWGRFLRPLGAGRAIRYELAASDGTVLETAFAKLALEPGKWDLVRTTAAPLRVYLRSGAGEAAPLECAVYRGKLVVASGRLEAGQAMALPDLQLRIVETRRWVELEMVRDPGIPLAAIAGGLAVVGGLASAASRRRGRVARLAERHPPRPGGMER